MGACVHFPIQHQGIICLRSVRALCTLPQPLWVRVCFSLVVSGILVSSVTSFPLVLKIFFPPFLHRLSNNGRDKIQIIHLATNESFMSTNKLHLINWLNGLCGNPLTIQAIDRLMVILYKLTIPLMKKKTFKGRDIHLRHNVYLCPC